MADNHRRTVLAAQHLAEAGNVVRERPHRELRCGDGMALGLQPLDDGAPAGAVGPRAVHENDVRLVVGCHGALLG